MTAPAYQLIPIHVDNWSLVHNTFSLNGLNVCNDDVQNVMGALYHFGGLKKTFKRDKDFKRNVRDAVEHDIGAIHLTHSLLPVADYFRTHERDKEKLYGNLLDADQDNVLVAAAQIIDKNRIFETKRLYTGDAREEHRVYYNEMMRDLFAPDEDFSLKAFFRDSYEAVRDALRFSDRKNKRQPV